MTLAVKKRTKPVIYASHRQYAIVNESDSPMNQWGIFTNPPTSIHLFHRDDIAEMDLRQRQKQFPKSELRHARVVEVCVTWEKLSESA
jgi:hypothetical protein